MSPRRQGEANDEVVEHIVDALGRTPTGAPSYTLVALLNAERAKLVSRLLFGDETSSKVAPALVYALGALASFQGLPQAAG